MAARNRVYSRLTGLFVRWGLIRHPYGREYVRDHYTLSGRRVPDNYSGLRTAASNPLVALVVVLLLSALAAGVLF